MDLVGVLPDDLDVVGMHVGVRSDEGEALDCGLCDQQTIEGVAVVHRQSSDMISMACSYRQ